MEERRQIASDRPCVISLRQNGRVLSEAAFPLPPSSEIWSRVSCAARQLGANERDGGTIMVKDENGGIVVAIGISMLLRISHGLTKAREGKSHQACPSRAGRDTKACA